MFEALHKRLLRRWWRRLLRASRRSRWRCITTAGGRRRPRGWRSPAARAPSAMVEAALAGRLPELPPVATPRRCLAAPPAVLRLKKHARVHQARQGARPLRARARAADEPAADRDGRVRRAGVRAAGDDARPGRRSRRSPSTRTSATRRACRASAESTWSCATARWSRTPSCAAAWRSSTGRCSSSTCAWSPRAARSASGSPPSCAPTARRTASSSAAPPCATACSASTRGACSAARATRCRRFTRACSRPTELAALWQLPSVDYLDRAVRAQRRAARARAARDPAARRRPRHAARRARARSRSTRELRKQNTAVPGTVEQGKSSYLVATVAEDLRRERCAVIVLDPKGDAAEAARERGARRAHVHAARLRAPDVRLQPARRGRARGRDRRLRRGGAEEPLHRRRHPRLLGPLPAQRDHRGARLRPRLRRCGTPRACCRSARRATPTAAASARACARCPSSRRSPSSSRPS